MNCITEIYGNQKFFKTSFTNKERHEYVKECWIITCVNEAFYESWFRERNKKKKKQNKVKREQVKILESKFIFYFILLFSAIQ